MLKAKEQVVAMLNEAIEDVDSRGKRAYPKTVRKGFRLHKGKGLSVTASERLQKYLIERFDELPLYKTERFTSDFYSKYSHIFSCTGRQHLEVPMIEVLSLVDEVMYGEDEEIMTLYIASSNAPKISKIKSGRSAGSYKLELVISEELNLRVNHKNPTELQNLQKRLIHLPRVGILKFVQTKKENPQDTLVRLKFDELLEFVDTQEEVLVEVKPKRREFGSVGNSMQVERKPLDPRFYVQSEMHRFLDNENGQTDDDFISGLLADLAEMFPSAQGNGLNEEKLRELLSEAQVKRGDPETQVESAIQIPEELAREIELNRVFLEKALASPSRRLTPQQVRLSELALMHRSEVMRCMTLSQVESLTAATSVIRTGVTQSQPVTLQMNDLGMQTTFWASLAGARP